MNQTSYRGYVIKVNGEPWNFHLVIEEDCGCTTPKIKKDTILEVKNIIEALDIAKKSVTAMANIRDGKARNKAKNGTNNRVKFRTS